MFKYRRSPCPATRVYYILMTAPTCDIVHLRDTDEPIPPNNERNYAMVEEATVITEALGLFDAPTPAERSAGILQRLTDEIVKIAQYGGSLEASLAELTKEYSELAQFVELSDALVFYFRLKTLTEVLNDCLKDINKYKTYLQYTHLPKMMNDNNVKTITVESINARFSKSSKLSVKGNPNVGYSGEELQAKIFEWLREVGAGSLIKETVNAASLSAFAKNLIEVEGKDLPEDLFEVSTSESVSVTPLKKVTVK